MAYENPIRIFFDEVEYTLEDNIFKATQRVGIYVDRDEMIKALAYDRDQYEKGYADGKQDASPEKDGLYYAKDGMLYKVNLPKVPTKTIVFPSLASFKRPDFGIDHDYSHCMDYDKETCPPNCFRAVITQALYDDERYGSLPVTFTNFKGTDECPLEEEEEDGE